MKKLVITWISERVHFIISCILGLVKCCLGLKQKSEYLQYIFESSHLFFQLKLLKTLYFNFRTLPYKTAVKIPILIYGRCRFISLSGQIQINYPIIEYGMIKIGISDCMRSYKDISIISIKGTMQLERNVTLRQGLRLSINTSSFLKLEEGVYIGDNVTIYCYNHIYIGKYTRLAYNCLMMDTDFHYIINTENYTIKRNQASIEIDNGNWIGSYTTIKKGTKTPNNTIVVGPYSTLSKNYTSTIQPNSIIAGNPARLIKENLRRIFNPKSEEEINSFFSHNNDDTFQYIGKDIESYCLA